jgi:hypothetical protein
MGAKNQALGIFRPPFLDDKRAFWGRFAPRLGEVAWAGWAGRYPGLCAAGRQVQGVIALNNNKNSADLDKQ